MDLCVELAEESIFLELFIDVSVTVLVKELALGGVDLDEIEDLFKLLHCGFLHHIVMFSGLAL